MTTIAPVAGQRAEIPHTGIPGLRLVRSELRKIQTTNAWWLFGIGALVFLALALWVNLASSASDLAQARHPERITLNLPPDAPPDQVAEARAQFAALHDLHRQIVKAAASIFTSGQFFGLVFVLLLGVLVMTNEFQHQTATATFLTTPRRSRVVVGKLVAAAGIAAVYWFITQAINLGVGLLFFHNIGLSNGLGEWDVQRAMLFNLASYLLWGVFGFGLGTLIRNQIGGIIVALVTYLVGFAGGIAVFNLIHEFILKKDWVLTASVILPPIASQIMVSPEKLFPESPKWWVGALVMIGWSVLAGAVGMWLNRRRDIS
jgi:ABC-2 type transport system permease protein